MKTDNRKALILGATGGIGGEIARNLLARGWTLRALHRGEQPHWPEVEWVRGDAMDAASVRSAAEGVSVIVHAVNPPGYRHWKELVLPMADYTIAAARAVGARIVLPGTVYNFGPETFPDVAEDAPQRPETVKGAIRVELERRLRTSGARVLIVRAGDFFGPSSGNNWFAQLVKPGRPVRTITWPGRPGVGHQWAYLPDVAETVARLLESDLPDVAVYHMGGHHDPDGSAMIGAIRRAAGGAKVRAFPWWLVSLAAPVVPLFRELREMRYLWETDLRLRNEALVAHLGAEPHTPLDAAVRATLAGLGCGPEPRAA